MTDQPGAAPVSVIDQPDSGRLFLHRHLFLLGLPQCYGRGAPGYGDDGAGEQNNENDHRHEDSPPPALAVRADRREKIAADGRLAL